MMVVWMIPGKAREWRRAVRWRRRAAFGLRCESKLVELKPAHGEIRVVAVRVAEVRGVKILVGGILVGEILVGEILLVEILFVEIRFVKSGLLKPRALQSRWLKSRFSTRSTYAGVWALCLLAVFLGLP